ncbi:MAG: thioredoxin family protein [Ignavibacteria bacterium]|nr:thioredoxin family protein [Ignavibacteria bacterium]
MNNKLNNIIESKSDFEIFLKTNEDPALVIIEADWCGTCKIMAPILENMANHYKSKIKFLMVDIDAAEEITKKYGLDKLPILLFFRAGNIIDQLIGTVSYSLLDEKIKTLLEISSTNNISNIK